MMDVHDQSKRLAIAFSKNELEVVLEQQRGHKAVNPAVQRHLRTVKKCGNNEGKWERRTMMR